MRGSDGIVGEDHGASPISAAVTDEVCPTGELNLPMACLSTLAARLGYPAGSRVNRACRSIWESEQQCERYGGKEGGALSRTDMDFWAPLLRTYELNFHARVSRE